MKLRPPLEGEHFDVLVIGGGINGVAIARECARAGRRTLLVEQHDFGAGTTSRSTRMIHGGLRYLEQGDIAQVRESLREREWLLRRYPHLVEPLEFLVPLGRNSRRSALAVRAGLWLYRRMAGARRGAESNGRQQAALERMLDSGHEFSIFSFEDAQCEFPERLVAEWLLEAMEAGCVARNHARVLEVEKREGRAVGARLRDQFSGKEERVYSSWTINAAGPWVDQVCRSSGITTEKPMVGGVRGSHIVLPRLAGAPEAAVYTEAVDGRPVFVIPWNEQTLVGTTEVRDEGDPSRVQPSTDEIEYLLRSLQRLFPQNQISGNDIRYAFAGVRPLPYSSGSNPSAVTRRHFFHDHASDGAARMISVIGGKLTTAAGLARECAARIEIKTKPMTLAIAVERNCDELVDGWVAEVAQAGGISPESARAIVEWHGKRSLAIVASARKRDELRVPLCPHTRHIVAEAVEAFSSECAVTLGDVLLRRVPVALGACWSPECSREAARRVANAMGWDDDRAAWELQGFEVERIAFLGKPAPTESSRPPR